MRLKVENAMLRSHILELEAELKDRDARLDACHRILEKNSREFLLAKLTPPREDKEK